MSPTTIWDTIDVFDEDYEIFYDALMKVKRKIENGYLSDSYAAKAENNGTSTNHQYILLNLSGKIRVGYVGGDTYAFADRKGIKFSRDLVYASSNYFNKQRFKTVEEALDDLDGLSYSAVFQETFEHGLVHLKHHTERVDDPGFNQERDTSLYEEAGYSIHRQNWSHSSGDAKPRILEMNSLNGWNPPLNLEHSDFMFNDGIIDVKSWKTSKISLDQLKAHMKYDIPAERRYQDDPVAKNKLERREGDENSTSPPVTVTSGNAAVVITEEVIGEKEVLHQPYQHIKSENPDLLDNSSEKKTTVDVQFCNMDKNPCTIFTTAEDIYVKLTFSVPKDSTEDAYVWMYRGRFSRRVIYMIIERTPRRHGTDVRYNDVATKISPGESHTFFRKFCCGSNNRKLWGGNWTPEKKVGTFYPEIKADKRGGNGQKFRFEIKEK
jgi:hypothetical protein